MDKWSIFIPLEPVGRAEMVSFRKTIIDKEFVREYKKNARLMIACKKPRGLFDGPLKLIVTAYLTRPKSVPKKRLYPSVKPDMSNILKSSEDCLKDLVITDDSRVVDQVTKKRYANSDHPVGVYIEVQAIDESLGVDYGD